MKQIQKFIIQRPPGSQPGLQHVPGARGDPETTCSGALPLRRPLGSVAPRTPRQGETGLTAPTGNPSDLSDANPGRGPAVHPAHPGIAHIDETKDTR